MNSINHHPFFHPSFLREHAITYVSATHKPVLRYSSIKGHLALSFMGAHDVEHILLRIANGKVLHVNVEGVLLHVYDSIYDIIRIVYPIHSQQVQSIRQPLVHQTIPRCSVDSVEGNPPPSDSMLCEGCDPC